MESGELVASIDGMIPAATLTAHGQILVVASTVSILNAHEIQFYDLTHPGGLLRRFPGTRESLSVTASPDDKLVAWSTTRGEVRLFDPAADEPIETLHAHLHSVFGIAFCPDGRRLASASGGREAVILWDIATRQELLTLSGTGSALSAVTWSADGEILLAGPPWQAWRVPSWREIAATEATESLKGKPR